MDLTSFASDVGVDGPVTIEGLATRGGGIPDLRRVSAPSGIDWIQADEMTVQCGAGTPVDALDAALAEHAQYVALPPGGTVGGALAVGRSGVRRLGDGPLRDALLQARYVNAGGELVKAGGATVKNVSGFDLCRLLVGSYGTLGLLGEVILRTRPRPAESTWARTAADPFELFPQLYRPVSVLWDGTATFVLLEGHPDDVGAQLRRHRLTPAAPPPLPTGGRWSLAPSALDRLRGSATPFVAEIGVGIVHHSEPAPRRSIDPTIVELHARIRDQFDPTRRLNPGIDVLAVAR